MNFNTSDLNLAGYLLASGMQLQSHHSEQGRTIFCIEQTDRLLQLVEEYYNMKAMINPQRYGSALKSLKNILYQRNYNHNYDKQYVYHQS